MTLCYTIKNGDIGLFKYALREICIMFQLPILSKPKYAKTILKQVYIFDIKAADLVFYKTYLANALVNSKDQPSTFYEMNLLLKYQNREFKCF